MEDLTTGAEPIAEADQLRDLAALGLDHDGEVVRQSDRTGLHDAAIERLDAAGLTYPCYCSRREIREAASAPHAPTDPTARVEGAYPGTCRDLTGPRADRPGTPGSSAGAPAAGRPGARVGDRSSVRGGLGHGRRHRVAHGPTVWPPTTSRWWSTTPTRASTRSSGATTCWTARLARCCCSACWGCRHPPTPTSRMVLGPDGARLSKRDGAVTLADRARLGEGAADGARPARRVPRPGPTG